MSGRIGEIQEVAIEKIRPYENNAKIHGTEQVKKIAESIKEFGFLTPCLIDKDYNLIAGHGRVMAGKQLGMVSIPCVFIEGLTDAQRKAYILADNRIGELGEWDMDIVFSELEDLTDMDFNIEVTGFELPNEEPIEVVEDEYTEDVDPIVKVGDLWQLGEHRLICGDSTDVNVIDALMDGATIDAIITDPPYGINAEKMTMGSGAKEFYRGKDWDIERPPIAWLLEIADRVCIWGGNYFTDELPPTNDWLVWWKKNDGLSFSECELAWTNFGNNVRHLSHHWGGEKKLHVTMKPVQVMAWSIQQTDAQNIADFFGGSGSTLIACEQLNHKCYICEIDPHYCDVIIQRWENLTGQKAKRIG